MMQEINTHTYTPCLRNHFVCSYYSAQLLIVTAVLTLSHSQPHDLSCIPIRCSFSFFNKKKKSNLMWLKLELNEKEKEKCAWVGKDRS